MKRLTEVCLWWYANLSDVVNRIDGKTIKIIDSSYDPILKLVSICSNIPAIFSTVSDTSLYAFTKKKCNCFYQARKTTKTAWCFIIFWQ